MDTIRFIAGIGLLALFSSSAVATPDIQHWRLNNGTGVYFVESHDLPVVQIKLAIDAGSVRDPAGLKGVAAMTARMLDEGTAKRDADDIAAGFESLGAQFGASASIDMTVIGLKSLSMPKYLHPALDIFKDVVLNPAFPETSLKREQQRMLVALQQNEQSPSSIVEKTFYQALYGTHPYSSRAIGDKAGISALNPEALRRYYRKYYVASNIKLIIVGDLSGRQARKLATRLAGDFPTGTRAPALEPKADLTASLSKHISFPSTQTHIRVGQIGNTRKDTDYFPMYVGNYILGGGGLVSRLFIEVREKHGLAYSVYSYFSPLKARGPFVMGMQTKSSQRHKALKLLKKELRRFIADGPTEKELVAAKKHITGGFPLRIDSNAKIADYLTVIAFNELPLSYLNDFNAQIEAVTVQRIRDAFKKRINPGKLAIVTVGDGR